MIFISEHNLYFFYEQTEVLAQLEAKKIPVDSFFVCEQTLKQLPETLSSQDALASALLTSDLFQNLAAQKPLKVGSFQIKLSKNLIHVECPIQLGIQDNNQHRIATIGFFLQSQGGKLELHINHIQGERKRQNELKLFSEQVGENWRVWVAKRLKRIAERKKAKPVGVLPSLFFLFGACSSPGEYKRQVRQYLQTFRKAGITTIDSHNVKPYPQKDREFYRKFKAEQRAKNKQNKPKKRPL
ncbi:MAG: hypothetical protein PHD95_00120 [Candidatus ainarchaeum sp.]|nr:hypothetical protein [Candidatus ainarchaeum sp.]